MRGRLAFHPLTPERLPDLAALFGPRGACAGCWCMWWKVTRAAFDAGRGDGNRRAMERQVRSGVVPGLLAYQGEEPVGWCAVEPRAALPRLAASRLLAPVDAQPVWSVTCFFVARTHRRGGLSRELLRAAVRHARRSGARVVEAYPVDPGGAAADARLYTGLLSTFAREGFEEVARRSLARPVVRKPLRPTRRSPAARRRAPRRSRAGSLPRRRSASRRGR